MHTPRFLSLVYMGVLAAGLLTTGCFRQEMQTMVIHVPQMQSEPCSQVIQAALSKVDGLSSAKADLNEHTVTVTYDSSKIARRNIEFVIAGAGFDANDIPARAPLPASCK